jgi:hypothetical protein
MEAPIHEDTNTPTKNMNTNVVTNPSPATQRQSHQIHMGVETNLQIKILHL